ncbi:hypothetical protein JKP88DRAFT_330933, partial [Tribonema minus]
GLGLFAKAAIAAGALVAELTGEVLPEHAYAQREVAAAAAAARSGVRYSSYGLKLAGGEVVDARHKGGVARFVNHACAPSCVARMVLLGGERRVGVFARRRLQAGDEVTVYYRHIAALAYPMGCCCGARGCVTRLAPTLSLP